MSLMQMKKIGKEGWVLLGCIALGAACVWPLKQLRAMPEKHQAIDHQLMQVHKMAAQALKLRAQNTQSSGDTMEKLQVAVSSTLGAKGSVSFAGDSASVMIQLADAQHLTHALQAIRQQTASRVTSATLNMQADKVSGRLELQLPAGPP